MGLCRAQTDQPPTPALAAAYAASAPFDRKMSAVPPFLAASGSIIGTPEDAVRAAYRIFDTAFLQPASRTALTAIAWPAENYALGGRVQVIDGTRWAWEAGKIGGYRTLIAHRLGGGETIAIFNTTDIEQSVITGWAEAIARG
jgi:D-alanyl-D-alanine carboxypeptidase